MKLLVINVTENHINETCHTFIINYIILLVKVCN